MEKQKKLVEYLTKEIDECRDALKKSQFCYDAGFQVESKLDGKANHVGIITDMECDGGAY